MVLDASTSYPVVLGTVAQEAVIVVTYTALMMGFTGMLSVDVKGGYQGAEKMIALPAIRAKFAD